MLHRRRRRSRGCPHRLHVFRGRRARCRVHLGRDHFFATEEYIRSVGLRFTFLRDNFYLDSMETWVGEDGVIRYHEETIAEAYRSRAKWNAPDWQNEAWGTTYTAIAAGDMAQVRDDVTVVTGTPPLSLPAPRTLDRPLETFGSRSTGSGEWAGNVLQGVSEETPCRYKLLISTPGFP